MTQRERVLERHSCVNGAIATSQCYACPDRESQAIREGPSVRVFFDFAEIHIPPSTGRHHATEAVIQKEAVTVWGKSVLNWNHHFFYDMKCCATFFSLCVWQWQKTNLQTKIPWWTFVLKKEKTLSRSTLSKWPYRGQAFDRMSLSSSKPKTHLFFGPEEDRTLFYRKLDI